MGEATSSRGPSGAPPWPEAWDTCPNQEGFSCTAGPYRECRWEDRWIRAFLVESRHLNPEGVVHGGVIASFADYLCYRAIGDVLGHAIRFATLTLTLNYLAAAKPGGLVLGQGRLTRQTRSVLFVAAEIEDGHRPIATASAVYKVIGA